MRHILHWDGDSFFASIEQAADRRLRHRPLVISGARRALVLSASPEAQRFGLRPGLPIARARRLCPPLTVIPAHFDLYEQFSEQILQLCEDRSPLVEEAAAGAGWLDLTGTEKLQGDPLAVARDLRRTVGEWLRVPLTFGLASNKLVARLAARLRKPHLPLAVPVGEERHFLAPLPVRWLPGLRPDAVDMLAVAGVRRLGDLATAPLDSLQLVLGRQALAWQRKAQGLDATPVASTKQADQRKSAHLYRDFVEFSEDTWETPKLLAALRQLLENVMPQVRDHGVRVRRLTLGLRYTDREENERSLTLSEPTAVEADCYSLLPTLLKDTWHRRVRLRALWLQLSRIHAPDPQMNLFEEPASRIRGEKEERLAAALDRLGKEFGKGVVRRGCALGMP